MLDQRLVRDNPEIIVTQLGRRGIKLSLEGLQLIAQHQKSLESRRSTLQSRANSIGKQVSETIWKGIPFESPEVNRLREIGNKIKRQVSILEEEEQIFTYYLKEQLLTFPNLPSKSCPNGKTEVDNVEQRCWGKPRQEVNLKNHWEIADKLGIIDTERSVRIAQSRFVTLIGQGAKLERALINFMLDFHTKKGYCEILPPILANTNSLTGSGQLPKFAEESFRCSEDDLWLIPTSEVPITSLHRDEIIAADDLPLKYVAYSPCFRREAGSYGRDTRGLIRLHQFNKVELYWFSHPDDSDKAHIQITADAEAVLQALELPYRVLDLCTGDIGFSATRTYDLEVWLPGANAYREISSSSNCADFQSRRSSIRMKSGKNTQLVHTLNASGLAIGRTMAALLETGQQNDGTVILPAIIAPYFGRDRLVPEH
uniref:Serine--tRNA ligase n=1 Tax=Paulinella chromatophora TaxID=39717 RepID=B1X3K2_PAUCH|nr:seryl-tRNA synthetase [Paulinella chromatophora]ACB42521.1 seryl-tRNA synthetase [Paulinella chromatophora]